MNRLTYTDEETAEFENMDCPVKDNDLVYRFCDRVCDEFQSNCPFKELGKKLKAYEDKEEQGLLIELPCKVGGTVYEIVDDCNFGGDCYTKRMCNGCEDRDLHIEPLILATESAIVLRMKDFGKTVFLTRSEAEEALAKMGGK